MVGENDIKDLFIYSIDEIFPEKSVTLLSEKKDGTVLFALLVLFFFLFLGDDIMIDLHYDLLSILYYCYKKNDFSYIKTIQKYYEENVVHGVVANLYFMSEDEMKEESGDWFEPVNVVERFRIATNLFLKFFPELEVIYSIEGCDYIEGPEELEELYKLGLRNILLVWNNKNRYGSGNQSDSGLTDEGRVLLRKAIDLGISIDLSHMNRNTFSDTVKLLKEEKAKGKQFSVIVSHSNCYDLYPHDRNLTDQQLLSIKEFSPVVGLVSYGPFVSSSEDRGKLAKRYVEHIVHMVELLGIDSVGVATDDMSFGPVLFGDSEDIQIFDYGQVGKQLTALLKDTFTEDEINQILYKNSYEKLFRKKE